MKSVEFESDELMKEMENDEQIMIIFSQQINGKWFVKYMELNL